MLNVRPLPENLKSVAISELNEVPERIPEDIEALRVWIEKQPYLKARTDDQFLLSFLRGCKFSLEKAKSKIDRYYTLRTLYPDFYTIQNVDDPKVLELLRLGISLYLPNPLRDNGPRILLLRPGSFPADKYNLVEFMRLTHGIQAITMLQDDYSNVNGILSLVDLSQLSAAHMFQMTPGIVRKSSTFAEDALPMRQKGTHIINSPAGWEPLFNTLKPLMSPKQQERMYMHGNKMESLYEHIPQKYLPKEYGGENGSIPELIAKMEATFREYRDFLIEDITYGTDEKLRPNASEDFGLFGAEGSFRHLNLD